MKFAPETKVTLSCGSCNTEEKVTLAELPHTPGRFFIFSSTIQCPTCLSTVCAEIKKGDEVEIKENESSDAVSGLSG